MSERCETIEREMWRLRPRTKPDQRHIKRSKHHLGGCHGLGRGLARKLVSMGGGWQRTGGGARACSGGGVKQCRERGVGRKRRRMKEIEGVESAAWRGEEVLRWWCWWRWWEGAGKVA